MTFERLTVAFSESTMNRIQVLRSTHSTVRLNPLDKGKQNQLSDSKLIGYLYNAFPLSLF